MVAEVKNVGHYRPFCRPSFSSIEYSKPSVGLSFVNFEESPVEISKTTSVEFCFLFLMRGVCYRSSFAGLSLPQFFRMLGSENRKVENEEWKLGAN